MLYSDRLIATNLSQTIRNLSLARSIMQKREESGCYQRQEGVSSDVLLFIDNADIVLSDELGGRLMIDLLQRGGALGVGVILAVSDIAALERDIDVMHELVSCRTKLAFMPEGNFYIDGLVARYGNYRPETWRDDTLTFILHRGVDGMSLGLLTSVYSVEAGAEEAQEWCSQQFAQHGISILKCGKPMTLTAGGLWSRSQPARGFSAAIKIHGPCQ